MESRYPIFVVGAFIFNKKGELFLRETPSHDNKFTCINGRVEWGKTIEETLRKNVSEKTNFTIESFELIGLTDGLNIMSSNKTEPVNMIFADYKVSIRNDSNPNSKSDRKYKWLLPSDWLKMNKNDFGPYIQEIIKKTI